MTDTLLAITIHQPWAAAISHGPKRIENRTWPLPEGVPTVMAIHASKTVDDTAWEDIGDRLGYSKLLKGDALTAWGTAMNRIHKASDVRGAIVAIASVTAYYERMPADADGPPWWRETHLFAGGGFSRRPVIPSSPWLSGPYGWILESVIALPTPVPCRGRQRLWRLPEDVNAAVHQQIEVALS